MLINGGPIALPPDVLDQASAVVEAFYPGELGGQASKHLLLVGDRERDTTHSLTHSLPDSLTTHSLTQSLTH